MEHLAGNDCMCTALAVLDHLLQLPHDALPYQQQPCAAQHTPLSAAAKHACELLLTQQAHSCTAHGCVSYLLTAKLAGRSSHSLTVFTVQQCLGLNPPCGLPQQAHLAGAFMMTSRSNEVSAMRAL